MDHFVHLIICRLKNKQKKERKKTLKLVLITEVILESFILENVTTFKEHILIQFNLERCFCLQILQVNNDNFRPT